MEANRIFHKVMENREKLYDPYKSKVDEYFMGSKAMGTMEQYSRALKRCDNWAAKVGVRTLPM